MEISEYEALVNELELRVERLRSLYDQYFMGIEKTVPSVPRKDVERRIQALRREQIRNTGLRFRFQMILQRYGTYQTYWQRICRQIEEGTYKRHVQKARAKIQAQEQPKRRDSGSYDIDVEFEMEMLEMESQPPADDLDPPTTPFEPPRLDPPTPLLGVPAPVMPIAAVGAPRPLWRKVEPSATPSAATGSGPRAPAAAPPPVAPKPAPPVAPPAPKPAAQRPAAAAPSVAGSPKPEAREAKEALTEARKRELYSRYVEAKRSRGESTVGITYESMSRTLRESSEKLREKHGKTVDFEVTVKDGKTILKPILK